MLIHQHAWTTDRGAVDPVGGGLYPNGEEAIDRVLLQPVVRAVKLALDGIDVASAGDFPHKVVSSDACLLQHECNTRAREAYKPLNITTFRQLTVQSIMGATDKRMSVLAGVFIELSVDCTSWDLLDWQ